VTAICNRFGAVYRTAIGLCVISPNFVAKRVSKLEPEIEFRCQWALLRVQFWVISSPPIKIMFAKSGVYVENRVPDVWDASSNIQDGGRRRPLRPAIVSFHRGRHIVLYVFRLSVPVQLIVWKDRVSEMYLICVEWDVGLRPTIHWVNKVVSSRWGITSCLLSSCIRPTSHLSSCEKLGISLIWTFLDVPISIFLCMGTNIGAGGIMLRSVLLSGCLRGVVARMSDSRSWVRIPVTALPVFFRGR